MDRQKLVERAFQKGDKLKLRNKAYMNWLEWFFQREYMEDVGKNDVTTQALLPQKKIGNAILIAKQEGIAAGIEEVAWFLNKHGVEVSEQIRDGRRISKGAKIFTAKGQRTSILATERVSLNVLQRMSGIATETMRLVDSIKNSRARIAATRKTVLRYLDKKAVYLGGGLTHRLGLWDSILIKDNHLQALKANGESDPIEKAIQRAARLTSRADSIEIEAANEDEAWTAAKEFRRLELKKPCIIMLDNWQPDDIRQIVGKLREANLYNHVLFEASGGITPDSLLEYAQTGIDVISLGYLTHSARILDMSLEMTM